MRVLGVLFVTAVALLADRWVAGAVPERSSFFASALLRALATAAPPVAFVLVTREKAAAFGVTFDPGRWWRMFVIALVLCLPLAVAMSRMPAAHAHYPRYAPARVSALAFLLATLVSGVQHLGWELLFRGFLLHGLAARFGRWALVLQAIPFALTHLPKGLGETLVSIPGGLVFGWIAWRARSFVPTGLLHWSFATTVNLAVVLWP